MERQILNAVELYFLFTINTSTTYYNTRKCMCLIKLHLLYPTFTFMYIYKSYKIYSGAHWGISTNVNAAAVFIYTQMK